MEKNLSTLLKKLNLTFTANKNTVTGITSDSREVRPGFIYIAISGSLHDGHDFITQAIKQGALWVIGEKTQSTSDCYSVVKDAREALAILACEFYDHPSRSLQVIGVTGTSGKTTTTYILESIFKSAGKKVGVMGTINYRYRDNVYPSSHTTPDAVGLQKFLFEMKKSGCEVVIMEVSSHAIHQKRTFGIAFDAIGFTNLSSEHLDFHKNMEDYFETKSKLFLEYPWFSIQNQKTIYLVINQDDEYGNILFKKTNLLWQSNQKVMTHAIRNQDSALKITDKGVHGKWMDAQIDSPLLGEFNQSNLLMAMTIAKALNISPKEISKGVNELQSIPGRLERVKLSRGQEPSYDLLVDYAHKPDALEKVLKMLKGFLNTRQSGRLLLVFGCGGDRDQTKRPIMGKIASEWADFFIVTSDNPRTEKAIDIINEIIKPLTPSTQWEVEVDRKKAIEKAIKAAQAKDIVLVAGKGHEDYQIIGTEKKHFDDREVIREILINKLDTGF